MNRELRNPVATRQLRTAEGKSLELRIGQPEPDGRDWACPFQILGLGEGKVEHAYGVDALQALLLAAEAARIEIASSGESVEWLGRPGSGIPRPILGVLGPDFEAHLHAVVDREVEEHVRRLKDRAGETEPG